MLRNYVTRACATMYCVIVTVATVARRLNYMRKNVRNMQTLGGNFFKTWENRAVEIIGFLRTKKLIIMRLHRQNFSVRSKEILRSVMLFF